MYADDRQRLWLWLSLIISPISSAGTSLIGTFDDILEIYSASESDYAGIEKLRRPAIERLCNKDLSEADKIIEYCTQNGIGILTPDSVMYPKRLRRIPNYPFILYYRGILRRLDEEVCIAAVGTRTMTEYGANNAYSISYDLARAGAAVVSGMARGVDGICHRGAVDAGGYTVAVLGNGLDKVYPPEHDGLMRDILRSGAVITEYAPGTPPHGSNFPARNRIISGLCQGTLVIEAGPKSGALITAEDARRQGRDLFALPGKVGEQNSLGTNLLLKAGAVTVTCAEDIISEYIELYPGKISLDRIKSGKAKLPHTPALKAAAPVPSFYEKQRGYDTSRRESDNRKETHKAASGSRNAGICSDNTITQTGNISKNAFDYSESASKSIEGHLPSAQKPQNEPSPVNTEVIAGLSESERKVYEKIAEAGSIIPDNLSDTGLTMPKILAALTMLELKKLVTAQPGGRYTLVK